MTHRTYTAQVAVELAEQFEEWRPITDLADEFKVEVHDDGTCDLLFRIKTVPLSSNGTGRIE